MVVGAYYVLSALPRSDFAFLAGFRQIFSCCEMWIVLIHAISEIGVCCPNFTGVGDKARNSLELK